MNKKAILRKLSFIISSTAVVMGIYACKTPKQQTEMQVMNLTPNMKFVINQKGECSVKNKQKISVEEFNELVAHGGFVWISTRIVLEMVNWIPKIIIGQYWDRVLLTITLKMGNATHSFFRRLMEKLLATSMITSMMQRIINYQ